MGLQVRSPSLLSRADMHDGFVLHAYWSTHLQSISPLVLKFLARACRDGWLKEGPYRDNWLDR